MSKQPTPPADPTPQQLGVGMRISMHPHCDDFVDVILGALGDLEGSALTADLDIETDEVSSYVSARSQPAGQRLAAYAAALLAATSRRSGGGHVVAHILLSRGCPGEVSCDLDVTGLPSAEPIHLEATGIRGVAQWSLYPLLDGRDTGDHMAHIEAAIASARERDVSVTSLHYATRLTGDIAQVLATAVDAWAGVGSQVPHVVTHLTVSVGSPTAA